MLHEVHDACRPQVSVLGRMLRPLVAVILALLSWCAQIAVGAGWIPVVLVALSVLSLHREVFQARLLLSREPYLPQDRFRFWPRQIVRSARRAGPELVMWLALALLVALDLLQVPGAVTGWVWLVAVVAAVVGGASLGRWYVRDARSSYALSSEFGIERVRDLPEQRLGLHAQRLELGRGFSDKQLGNIQRYAESQFRTVVDFDLGSRPWAVIFPVDDDELKATRDIAHATSTSPWDWWIDYQIENGVVTRMRVRRDPVRGLFPEDRELKYRAAISCVPGGNPGWKIIDDQQADETILEWGRPLVFDSVVPYDWATANTYEAIPFAVGLNDEVVHLSLIESNMLLGGVPGGGKSGGLTAIIADCARLPHVAIVGLDPKRVEQAMWRDRFSHIANTLDGALDTLQALTEEMDRRYDLLADQLHKKKVTADMLGDDLPLIVVVADEMAELVAMGMDKDEKAADLARIKCMQRLVQKGRAAGICFIGATQKPEGQVIPTNLRDLIQQRVAYATTTPAMTDTILGSGMSSNGGAAHTIEHDQKGVCYVVNESSRTPVKARTLWIPDDDVPAIAARTAHLRVRLPFLEDALASDEGEERDNSSGGSEEAPGKEPSVFDRFRDLPIPVDITRQNRP